MSDCFTINEPGRNQGKLENDLPAPVEPKRIPAYQVGRFWRIARRISFG
jgi:hypothetical protein